MLLMCIWWEALINPGDGDAVGFTIRGADLGVTMSFEESTAAAKEQAGIVRRRFGGK